MLTLKTILLHSASKPEESLIPDLRGEESLPFFKLDESVPRQNRLHLGEGTVPSSLPYTVQSLYERDFAMRPYRAAILENDFLRATFLPELGGRLFSLYHKKLDRELVYQNDVIAFANLALRNAWFAGGVEWNVGVRGHTHFTCSPLFVCREENEEGEEILKMYEYEAIRGLAYVIRAGLCGDELRVNVTVENTKNEDTYLYWWSNIAVPQTEQTRVFVPADKSYITDYRDGGFLLSRAAIPHIDGEDISYPARAKDAKDYFFDIPDERKHWIAAIEGDGIGLLQSSSEELIGRKLFVWGNTVGGKHWNSWLTNGGAYAEIQAGLAKTQFEHIPMGAKKKVTWNESYRAVCTQHKDGCYADVCEEIDQAASRCDFGRFFSIKSSSAPLMRGSGRGALAALLSPDEAPTVCQFTKADLTERDTYFASLIEGTAPPTNPPVSYSIDARYLDLIDKKAEKTDYDRYLYGVIAAANGMIERAEQALLTVGGAYEWLALAALAQIEVNFKKDVQKGYRYVRRAVEIKEDLSLLILFGEIAIKAEQHEELARLFKTVNNGRVQMYRTKSLMELGRLDEARAILSPDLVVPDMREGEYALATIWCALYSRIIAKDEGRVIEDVTEEEIMQKYPIPYELDFRMH